MKNKLFVGGLSWNIDTAGLKKAFGSFGDIEEAIVIMDRETGKSRGFGFVTFAQAEDAGKALSMDCAVLDGRTLKVKIAQERERRGKNGPRRT